MKYILACLALIVTISFLEGCSDSISSSGGPADSTNFRFPMNTGNSWTYKKESMYFNIRPDSIKRLFDTNTIYGGGTITINNDTLINSIPVRPFGESSFTNEGGGTIRSYGTRYFADTDSGLVCYGHRGGGGNSGFPYRPNTTALRFKYHGKIYNSIFDLIGDLSGGDLFDPPRGDSSSLILETPPVICLKYPQITGTSWLFKTDPLIYKRYHGFENINVPAGSYSAIKTQRDFSSIQGLTFYDHYTKFGQMKRHYKIKDIVVTNEIGQELGHVDWYELAEVIHYSVNLN